MTIEQNIRREAALDKIIDSFSVSRTCYLYGLPKIGKTKLVNQYNILIEGLGKKIINIDLYSYIASIIANKESQDNIKKDDLLGIGEIEKLSSSNTYAIIVDHIDCITIYDLTLLKLKTLMDIGNTLNALKEHCFKNRINIAFCARGNHRYAKSFLMSALKEAPSFYTDKNIEEKINMYAKILIPSGEGMNAVFLVGYSNKELDEAIAAFFPVNPNSGRDYHAEFKNEAKAHNITHPILVTHWLSNLQSLIKSSDENCITLINDSLITSKPTFHNIFESYWKYSIYQEGKQFLLSGEWSENKIRPSSAEMSIKDDLFNIGILIRHQEEDCYQFFSDLFYEWFISEKMPQPQREYQPITDEDPVKIAGEVVHIKFNGITTELTRQAARFFICLYNTKGKLVLLKDIAEFVFGPDVKLDETMNKIYQVKKIVSQKIDNTNMTIIPSKSKGSNKGYTLYLKNKDDIGVSNKS